ncbi:MAG TPA: bifunctional riboflavin kinase/FAD synthetase [Pseudolabrys sp.]|jgi:riboflavin kinase/FMN adenylyltransferase|nr:bifunctional riboflavin kinase/FAD synthetase [Pseudolabrys sp.]
MNSSFPTVKPFHVARGPGQAIDAGPLRGAVLAIGNFDGVHRGHRAVIGAALARARALGRKAAALTFEPHPRRFFRPQEPLFRLTSPRDKLRLLATTGLDGALVMTFDAALASTPADDFIARILVGRLEIAGAVIGFDFHFGKARKGSPAFLAEQGTKLGFAVDVVPPLEDDEGRPVSSGAVRAALADGKVVEAAELLGAPWFVSGEVVHGEKRGRGLDFPTANMKLDPDCGLKHGIYAVRARIDGEWRDAVASFGRRPTFDDGAPLLETFLFDFAGDLYGRTFDIAFIGWLRQEQKFDSVDALKRQMAADAAQARDILRRAPGVFPALGCI